MKFHGQREPVKFYERGASSVESRRRCRNNNATLGAQSGSIMSNNISIYMEIEGLIRCLSHGYQIYI